VTSNLSCVPSVHPAFHFLLESQPQPAWGPERVLIDRADLAAPRLQTLAEIPSPDDSQLEFLRRTSKAEQRFWERHSTSWFKPAPRCTPPPFVEPPWWTPKSPFEFFSDTNTPLPGPFREPVQFRYTPPPGPWREPIKFRYFEHTPGCPNKLSPNDLVDSYDRPRNVRACPHCHGLLHRGESAPNTWHTPLHWDIATQEVFGGRPIPRSSRLVIEDGVRKVEGDWEDWVVPELKSWSTSQKKPQPLDQNYFEPARMQGAVRNKFCIFRVLPDESNTPQISHSYSSEIDDKDREITKPIVCLRMDVDPGDRALEEGLDESESDTKRHYRLAPWKLMPFVFENGGSVFRVWWLSVGPGKNVASTDTVQPREEYELDSKTIDDKLKLLGNALELFRATLSKKQKAISIKKENLWCVTANNLPRPTKEMQEEWEKILRAFKLQPLKFGTRETHAVDTTRRTRYGGSSRTEHDSLSGVKVNTLRQREIRRMRKAAKKTDAPLSDEDEIPLLIKYVNHRPSPNVDLLCRGGCFALVQLHHLELKYLGPYSATVTEVFTALELERRKSLRNATSARQ
jgi:hypothetical protein